MGGLAWACGTQLFLSCPLLLGLGSPAFSEGCSQMPELITPSPAGCHPCRELVHYGYQAVHGHPAEIRGSFTETYMGKLRRNDLLE